MKKNNYEKWVADTLGTNDMACVLELIRAAREVEANGSHRTLKALREALLPFAAARTVPAQPNDGTQRPGDAEATNATRATPPGSLK